MEQLSLFPSEQEQIQSIQEAESASTAPSASSFTQDEIDLVLRMGGNTVRTRETAVALFSKQKNLADTAQELRAIYQGGNGFTTEAGSFAVWYTDDGIRLARGRQARYIPSAQLVPWETAAERVEAMLHAGTFAPQSELDAALGHERDGVALRLDYLCGDFTEEARSAGYLASISGLIGLHHPDSEQKISELLADPKSRASITQEYQSFLAAYRDTPDQLLRFHYHKVEVLEKELRELALPRETYTATIDGLPSAGQFITEDEIDAVLASGSGMSDGKRRIYSEKLPDGVDACYIPRLNEVRVRDGQSQEAMRESLLIEFGHSQLAKSKGYVRSPEANFVAYTSAYLISQHFRLEMEPPPQEAFPASVDSPGKIKEILSSVVSVSTKVCSSIERAMEKEGILQAAPSEDLER